MSDLGIKITTTTTSGVREYTFRDIDGVVAFLDDLTGQLFRDELRALEGEERLSLNDLKDNEQPVDTKYFNVDNGVLKLSKLVKDSLPGLAPKFIEVEVDGNIGFREIVAGPNFFIACNSNFGNFRIHVSVDGVNLTAIETTGKIFYIIRVSRTGTIIAVSAAATDFPDSIMRSTDGLRTYSFIEPPESMSLYGLANDGHTDWVACARFGDNGRIIYSLDDGVTWSLSSYTGEHPYWSVAHLKGVWVVVADSGTNRIQRSVDRGQSFTAVTGINRFWTKIIVYKNLFVLMRSGTSSSDVLAFSSDYGLNWTSAFPTPDSNYNFTNMCVIGEWLYIFGIDGIMYRTRDLDSFEAVDSGTTENISAMAVTYIDGNPVIMATCTSGNKIITSKNLEL